MITLRTLITGCIFWIIFIAYGIWFWGPRPVVVCIAIHAVISGVRGRWQYVNSFWALSLVFCFTTYVPEYGPTKVAAVLLLGLFIPFFILKLLVVIGDWLSKYIKFLQNPDDNAFFQHEAFHGMPKDYVISFKQLLEGEGDSKISPDMRLQEVLELEQCYFSFRLLLAAYFQHPKSQCTADEIDSIKQLPLSEFIVLCYHRELRASDYESAYDWD